MNKIFFLMITAMSLIACKQNNPTSQEQVADKQDKRIISLSGSITEVLVDLGEKENIVAVDVTSTYPTDVKSSAQDLGHTSQISLENIISLKPTTVYVLNNELSEEKRTAISNAGIKLQQIDLQYTIEGTKQMIKQIALNEDKSEKLYKEFQDKIDQELSLIKELPKAPKILFIYARGASTLLVAGEETPIDKVITLAGAKNAATGFTDFKPLTPEFILQANPDYILMFNTGLQSLGSIEDVLKIDAIKQTNAGKNRAILTMDGQLLGGFGPRVSQAIKELNSMIQ